MHKLTISTALGLLAVTAAGAAQAQSTSIEFRGRVDTTCSFSATSSGSIAPSADQTRLSSTEGAGSGGRLDVGANGSVEVTFAALRFTSAPDAYDTGGAALELRVQNESGSVLSNWSAGAASVSLGFPGENLVIDARATDPAAFPAGDYRLQTTVTCAPTLIGGS